MRDKRENSENTLVELPRMKPHGLRVPYRQRLTRSPSTSSATLRLEFRDEQIVAMSNKNRIIRVNATAPTPAFRLLLRCWTSSLRPQTCATPKEGGDDGSVMTIGELHGYLVQFMRAQRFTAAALSCLWSHRPVSSLLRDQDPSGPALKTLLLSTAE